MNLTTADFFAMDRNKMVSGDFLGKGMMGSVYATDDPTKVIRHSRDMSDGWLTYAMWCMQENRGEYALKVYSIRFENDPNWGGGEYFALIERADRTVGQCEGDDWEFYTEWMDQIEEYNEFLEQIRDNVYPCLDIHDGNIMIREDGSLVVTDPLYGSNDTTLRTLYHSVVSKSGSIKTSSIPHWVEETDEEDYWDEENSYEES